MISIEDFRTGDGPGQYDWAAYGKAKIAAGETCCRCRGAVLVGRGRPTLCTGCRDLDHGTDEVTHDSRVRCPRCGHVESPYDADDPELYDEGEHAFVCGACDHDYVIETLVSYSWQSPARHGEE